MKVEITRRCGGMVEGVTIPAVGDCMEVPAESAAALIENGWAKKCEHKAAKPKAETATTGAPETATTK